MRWFSCENSLYTNDFTTFLGVFTPFLYTPCNFQSGPWKPLSWVLQKYMRFACFFYIKILLYQRFYTFFGRFHTFILHLKNFNLDIKYPNLNATRIYIYIWFVWVFYWKFLYLSNFTPLTNTFFAQISFCTPSDQPRFKIVASKLWISGEGRTDRRTDRQPGL